jgi:uncharacterized membrane protein YphA (DoxX/SURF4 family)
MLERKDGQMKALITIIRVAMGLYLLGNGVNFFFEFYAFPPVENETANLLMAGFVQSGMFEVVKLAEVLCGLALIFNLYVPLALVVTYPIVVIIAYIDILILRWELGGIVNGGIFFVVYTALLLLYLPYYRTMFVRKAEADPSFKAPSSQPG